MMGVNQTNTLCYGCDVARRDTLPTNSSRDENWKMGVNQTNIPSYSCDLAFVVIHF